MAAGGMDTLVEIYNLESGEESTIEGGSGFVTGLAYTPDGSRLATVSPQQVTFWDTQTCEQIGKLRVIEEVRRVGFLPDGSGMITTSLEGYARLWKALPPGGRLLPEELE